MMLTIKSLVHEEDPKTYHDIVVPQNRYIKKNAQVDVSMNGVTKKYVLVEKKVQRGRGAGGYGPGTGTTFLFREIDRTTGTKLSSSIIVGHALNATLTILDAGRGPVPHGNPLSPISVRKGHSLPRPSQGNPLKDVDAIPNLPTLLQNALATATIHNDKEGVKTAIKEIVKNGETVTNEHLTHRFGHQLEDMQTLFQEFGDVWLKRLDNTDHANAELHAGTQLFVKDFLEKHSLETASVVSLAAQGTIQKTNAELLSLMAALLVEVRESNEKTSSDIMEYTDATAKDIKLHVTKAHSTTNATLLLTKDQILEAIKANLEGMPLKDRLSFMKDVTNIVSN